MTDVTVRREITPLRYRRVRACTAVPGPGSSGRWDMTSTWPEVVEQYLVWFRLSAPSENTIISYRHTLTVLDRWLTPHGGLLGGTQDLIEEWRTSLTSLSPSAVLVYMAAVRGFYTWAHAKELIEGPNPALGVPLPHRRRMIPRPIGEEDLEFAIALAPRRIRPWLVLAAYAGLRAQEIAYLRREDILDGVEPRMLVVSRDAAKGRVERVVPLFNGVWVELVAYGLPRRGYLFLRLDSSGPNTPKRVSQLVNAHLHDCEIDYTLHSLRHRAGTMGYRVSKDLRAVQEFLGHASITTTAGYAAIDQETVVDMVEEIQRPIRHLRQVKQRKKRRG